MFLKYFFNFFEILKLFNTFLVKFSFDHYYIEIKNQI
jgi:hypothetical protein